MINTLPTIEENPNGLHQRYTVAKNNGEPVDPNAVYFVMRIDRRGRDKSHVAACRAAILAYVDHIREHGAKHLMPLADDLVQYLKDSDVPPLSEPTGEVEL